MKTSGTHAFVNQVLVGLLVTIGFGGSVGLGTVWMRHQISVVADTNAALQKEYEQVLRRLADTSTLVEAAMSSDVLRRANEQMKLGLVELNTSQITSVTEDPVRRLVARANRRVFEREAEAAGVGIQLPLEMVPATPAERTAALPAAVPANESSHSAVVSAATRPGIQLALRR